MSHYICLALFMFLFTQHNDLERNGNEKKNNIRKGLEKKELGLKVGGVMREGMGEGEKTFSLGREEKEKKLFSHL